MEKVLYINIIYEDTKEGVLSIVCSRKIKNENIILIQ